VAAIGNGAGFKQGRDFGAWLGLVPRQESTGDRTILGKISKRGNKYLRTLFVQAAHVVLVRRPGAAMRGLWPWIVRASKRLHRNMLAIALANKLARIAWDVLARGHAYQPRIALDAASLTLAHVHQGDRRHPLSATVARHKGERATVAPRGWLYLTPDVKRQTLRKPVPTFPPRSARWNEEMDERSARRNPETGCHNDLMRSLR